MTREEAIKWMEETIQDAGELLDKCSPVLKEEVLEQNEVFKIAISALRSTPHPGKPLTLDQLREMDGQPAWCEDVGRWAIVSVSDAGKWKGVPFALFVRDGARFEWNIEDRNLSLYSYSPEQVGRERWSGCLICRGTKYMYGDAVSGYGTREVRGGVVFHYCPMCGRPLTEEAWVELERRLRG